MSAQRLKILFSKRGDLRFISHLDLMRLFQRASRRAELPVTLTKGFNPHLKISITKALKLGVESNAEEAVFSMERRMGTDDFKLLFNKALPAGIRVESVEELASNG